MWLDVVGLASAVAVWAAALWLALRERRRLIAALPADWRHDPELESLYDRAVGARVDWGSWVRPPGLYATATALVWFVFIAALGLGLGHTLVFVGLLAVVFTASARDRHRRRIEGPGRAGPRRAAQGPPRPSIDLLVGAARLHRSLRRTLTLRSLQARCFGYLARI